MPYARRDNTTMSYMRHASVTEFEGSEQLMVVGVIEGTGGSAFSSSQSNLTLITADGLEFHLVSGSDVEGLGSLDGKKVSILAIVTEEDEIPTLTVLGYRLFPVSNQRATSTDKSNKPFRWKAAS
jgi:hypothetical protein